MIIIDKVYKLAKRVALIIEHNAEVVCHSIPESATVLNEEQKRNIAILGAGALAVSQMLDMATKYKMYVDERIPHDEHEDMVVRRQQH